MASTTPKPAKKSAQAKQTAPKILTAEGWKRRHYGELTKKSSQKKSTENIQREEQE